MGSGAMLVCPKCGFKFTRQEGAGFLFPKIYKETIEKAKSGELGPEIQKFLAEHEDGAVNAESATLCCDECGHLQKGRDLTMYVPISGRVKEKSDYVMRFDLEEDYKEYARYRHICEKCGGEMHVAGRDEQLLCPECKTPLEEKHTIMWD